MQEQELPPIGPRDKEQYSKWWSELSPTWKRAFNEVVLRRTSEDPMPDDALHHIWHAPALRFAGPQAPFPNMSFELDNLDGVLALHRVEIFVFTFHNLRSIKPLAQVPQIKSLFLFNNRIDSLEGVEALTQLQELYFNVNEVRSLKPLEKLTGLHTLYCNYNHLHTLEGIGPQHAGTLQNFFCLPNNDLPDTEIIRMEREVGIRCQKG